jgi:hypothetical protein
VSWVGKKDIEYLQGHTYQGDTYPAEYRWKTRLHELNESTFSVDF